MLCLSMGGSQHSEGEHEPPKQQESITQSQGITSQKTQILTVSPVLNTLGYVSTKIVSRAQEDCTIAQFSNYNFRVLEHCKAI